MCGVFDVLEIVSANDVSGSPTGRLERRLPSSLVLCSRSPAGVLEAPPSLVARFSLLRPGGAAPSGSPWLVSPGGAAPVRFASRIRLIRGRTVSSHIMPGMDAASRPADLRPAEALSPKLLYAVDARLTPSSPVTDVALLTSLTAAAVADGDGHVLDTSHVIFPNGAITLVLILAESHLSIHTWPEEALIAIDLFSCGTIDGGAVISGLTRSLRLEAVSVRRLDRGAVPGGAEGRPE
jgi:S-adenosylmethionine decarboxylase